MNVLKEWFVMVWRVIGFVIFASFYAFYLAKLVILKKQEIKTNQMGVGNKERRVLAIERVMSVATVLTVVFGLGSILVAPVSELLRMRIAGILAGVLAVVVFGMATITMKDSWRVGIPEEKTALITNGIYAWSRNPAFVGFDLLYLAMCLLFFNVPLVLVSVWAAVMLHLQILQEEKHLLKMLGVEYEEYRKRTMRYWGRIV